MLLDEVISEVPVIAILRGLEVARVEEVCTPLVAVGVRAIEIPLNRPQALECIETLKRLFSSTIALGAGTVLSPGDVDRAQAAGAQYIISPNFDPDVVKRTLEKHLVSMPGIQTPSELFAAYKLGARYFKLFPFENMGEPYLKAITAVLPDDARVIPVGGIRVDGFAHLLSSGAYAVGMASDLYKPGLDTNELHIRIEKLKKEVAIFHNKR